MQRKHFSIALIAAAIGSLFAGGVSVAFAQLAPQTADMSVTGTIVPPACSVAFDGGGEVNFGTIRLIDLPPNAYHSLGSQNTALRVSCTTNKQVNFQVRDLQSSSRISDAQMYALLNTGEATNDAHMFGLGTATVGSSTVNLGSYAIRSANRSVGGTVVGDIYSDNAGASWAGVTMISAVSTNRLNSAGNGNRPAAGREFIFPLQITAALNYGSRLQVADDTRLNGQVQFSINYQ